MSDAELSAEESTLRRLRALDEVDSPLGQSALVLARHLDRCEPHVAAGLAKELRATMKELTPDDGGDAFAQFLADVSAEVRDSPTS